MPIAKKIHRSGVAFFVMVLLYAFGGVAAGATQTGIIYDCDITDRVEQVGWISPKLAVVVTNSGDVKIIDAVLISFGQSPATARVTRDTDRVLSARWRVRNARDSAGQVVPDFGFDLRLNKQNLKIVVGANPYGFATRFSGRGTCAVRKR